MLRQFVSLLAVRSGGLAGAACSPAASLPRALIVTAARARFVTSAASATSRSAGTGTDAAAAAAVGLGQVSATGSSAPAPPAASAAVSTPAAGPVIPESAAARRKLSPEESSKAFDASTVLAVRQILACAIRHFNESVDIAVNLLIEKNRLQDVRGIVQLPFGTGKEVRIAVFAKGEHAKIAQEKGASVVGAETLVEQIQKGNINFDKVIATPDMMPMVTKVARILGPRGLMPNPKFGTVTPNIAEAIAAARGGQIEFRAGKDPILHASIGKVSMAPEHLAGNIRAYLEQVLRARPLGKKGNRPKGAYFASAFVSSTMGPSVQLSVDLLEQAMKAAKQ